MPARGLVTRFTSSTLVRRLSPWATVALIGALLLGTLFLALGIQSIALGLVAEIIVHLSAPTRRPYRLARVDSADSDDLPG